MNKKSILAAGLICLLVTISGCSTGPNYDHFDLAEGLVDVQTRIEEGEKQTLCQYTLASGQRIQPIESFVPDEAVFYEVPRGCFESYIDDKVLNRLVRMELLDAEGRPVEISEDIESIFRCVEQLEHDLFTVRIIETKGLYFVYVELNVNLWLPCTLYFYNPEERRLVELYTWDSKKIVALHVRSEEGLMALE